MKCVRFDFYVIAYVRCVTRNIIGVRFCGVFVSSVTYVMNENCYRYIVFYVNCVTRDIIRFRLCGVFVSSVTYVILNETCFYVSSLNDKMWK